MLTRIVTILSKTETDIKKNIWDQCFLAHLVAKAAVVHRGQAVVDGGSSVLVERLASRLSLQVTVLQGLHHRLGHLALNLGNHTVMVRPQHVEMCQSEMICMVTEFFHLLLGFPGQWGVILQKRSQGKVCSGQLPVDTVPHRRVAFSACQRPHSLQVVVYGLEESLDQINKFIKGQDLVKWR